MGRRGAYFEDEFVVNGRLVLYAHFEEVEARMADDNGSASDYELPEEEGRVWDWGSHHGKAVRHKVRQL